MAAAHENHLDIVEALLTAGADPNIKARHGMTALKAAKEMGFGEIVERLKKAGAKN